MSDESIRFICFSVVFIAWYLADSWVKVMRERNKDRS